MIRFSSLAALSLAASMASVSAPALACEGGTCHKGEAAHTANAAPSVAPVAIPADHKATANLSITGMSCGDCSSKVTVALMKVLGVGEAKVDHATGLAVIVYDNSKVTVDSLVKAVNELGYVASPKVEEKKKS